MAGQKNKTTHKHNYKIISSGKYAPTMGGVTLNLKYEHNYCICGSWFVSFFNNYGPIYLPPNFFIENPPKKFKIINP